MSDNNILTDIVSASTDRRSLLKKLGYAGAALTAAGTLGSLPLGADPANPTPFDIVQFALNLEYLEAEFYSVATTGKTLQQSGIDVSGPGEAETTTMYGKVNFSNNFLNTSAVVKSIAADEVSHVKFLRAALKSFGQTPVGKPAINLDALAGFGASLKDEPSFLLLARVFEDIGVSAYSGAAAYLAPAPAVLTAAARILAAEGTHSGAIRFQVARFGLKAFALDGADVVPPPAGTDYFPTADANGLVATRTPGQVLYLAYGLHANATKGGFYPNGVNGNLHTSSSAATSANLS